MVPRVDFLSEDAATRLFGSQGHHVPVSLRRVGNSRLIWLNGRAMNDDPCLEQVESNVVDYARHILSACSFVVPGTEVYCGNPAENVTVGYADRYGGGGIGRNGGSGRSVVVNGYLVKGVGKTPLVSSMTSASHGSGYAHIEECIREAIYSEVVAAEFPSAAIPALAIIDTGFTDIWDTGDGATPARRALLVRPCFPRPAHFERAINFMSGVAKEGMRDTARVRQFFDCSADLWGRDTLEVIYTRFWPRWAMQLAYSFVHRLPHGGNSSSNICLDARLVDFGGMVAVPSWAKATTIPGRKVLGDEFKALSKAVQSLSYYFGRYLNARFCSPETIRLTTSRAWQAYAWSLGIETLRLFGLTRTVAESAVSRDPGEVSNIITPLFGHYQRERFDVIDSTPEPRITWDIAQVWDRSPPRHLAAVRALLDKLVPSSEQADVAQTCRFRSRTRETLYREHLKYRTCQVVEESLSPGNRDVGGVSRHINDRVAAARRDSRIEPEHASPIGFATGSNAAYALFRCRRHGTIFAVAEWFATADPANLGAAVSPSGEHFERIPVRSWTSDSIEFVKAPQFYGSVAIDNRDWSINRRDN